MKFKINYFSIHELIDQSKNGLRMFGGFVELGRGAGLQRPDEPRWAGSSGNPGPANVRHKPPLSGRKQESLKA